MDYLPTNTFSFAAATTMLAVSIFTYLFYIIIIKKNFFLLGRSSKNKVYHPVVGTKLNQILNFTRLHDYATDLAREHKTYRFPGVFRSEIYTCDPTNVEYILKTNFQNYGKGSYNHNILNELMGDGMIAVDGDKWRNQRKVASTEFSPKVLKEISTVVFQRFGAKLARIVSENATSNLSMDIQDLFMKSTLDTMVKVSLGEELNSLCGGSSEEGMLFAYAFDEANAMTMWRYIDFSWKIKRFLNIGSEAKLKCYVKILDAFMYKIIRSKSEQISSISQSDHNANSMRKQDILSRFLYSQVTDHKYLRDIILNLIIAGKDSSTAALSWFFYNLCKHPEIQEKVAEEVREATKMDDNMSFEELAVSVTTDEALDKMPYLHAAITETLRLHPSVPVDAKICFSDDTLPDGFSVRKGDMVSYHPYAMGRMKFLWGDDTDDFRPERWLNDHGIFQSESPFKFTVFQAGPRMCLGKEFAYRQIKIFSAILLGFFTFKLSDETKAVTYRTTISLQVAGGLHLRAFPRLLHKIAIQT